MPVSRRWHLQGLDTLATSYGMGLENMEITMDHKEAANILGAKYGKLPEKDHAFALSILSAYKSDRLSLKQAEWLVKLAERIANPPKKTTIETTAIRELFATAAAKLKHPKFAINSDAGTIQFSIAGAKSKVPSAINVTDGGRFGSNKYFGRILPDGTWQSYAATNEVTQSVKQFATNPAKMAASHGKMTGHCCFCSRSLSDDTSINVGYGKVCADNWGLPWA